MDEEEKKLYHLVINIHNTFSFCKVIRHDLDKQELEFTAEREILIRKRMADLCDSLDRLETRIYERIGMSFSYIENLGGSNE